MQHHFRTVFLVFLATMLAACNAAEPKFINDGKSRTYHSTAKGIVHTDTGQENTIFEQVVTTLKAGDVIALDVDETILAYDKERNVIQLNKKLPEVLQKAKDKGVIVLCITSGSPTQRHMSKTKDGKGQYFVMAKKRPEELKALGIPLSSIKLRKSVLSRLKRLKATRKKYYYPEDNGILYAGGRGFFSDKGTTLIQFFLETDLYPAHLLFADNSLHKVILVSTVMGQFNIPCTCIELD